MSWKYTKKGKTQILSKAVFCSDPVLFDKDGYVRICMKTDISSPKDIQEHQRIFKHLLDSIKFR